MRQNRAILIWLVFLSIIACPQSVKSSSHNSWMLKHAKKVGILKEWDMESYPSYSWLSDHEILFWRRPPNAGREYLYRHNIKNGAEKLIGDTSTHAEMGPKTPIVSPDGIKLFWIDGYMEKSTLRTKNGNRLQVLPEAAQSHIFGYDIVYWLQDNRHWLILDWVLPQDKHMTNGPKRILVGGLGHAPMKVIPISKQSPLYMLKADMRKGAMVKVSRMLVMADTDSNKTPIKQIDIYELDILNGATISRQYTITLPFSAVIKDYAFSPRGERIAWKLVSKESSKQKSISNWICNVDGSKMHELCSLPDKKNDKHVFGDLQWLPKNNKISFISEKRIWIVPAE